MAQSQIYEGRENKFTAGNNVLNLDTGVDYTFYFISDGDLDGTEDASGDLILDANGGLSDPDTMVVIDGVAYEFILEGAGELPVDGKVPTSVQGTTVVKIEVVGFPTPLKLVFSPDGSISAATWAQFGNGNISLDALDTDPTPVCFCNGTLIRTSSGFVAVESLANGDRVALESGKTATIKWIGSRTFSLVDLMLTPSARPVCIPAGALGNGTPTTDLWVSPQHRVLIQGYLAETLFGVPEVLVAAKHLDFGDLAKGKKRPAEVEYFHILLDKHDVLIANGAPAESLFLGNQAQTMLSDDALAEIEAKFPREDHAEMWNDETAATVLKAYEGAVLSEALRKGFQHTHRISASSQHVPLAS
ncbi:Hint domain-containing protein [Aliiroseovarius sp. PrR006]|uniref:Hint domain-containing protein n=1 Tax=Aliiroseovarius sp. PrR006 TaxID=2706883 RepID=UPI0013D0F1A0|nr:Hint domain-containing protein [Aliiroseovarius sp. PrR006]NDW53774.1 Hint domain-containing protein [Aliiroseovarius sp. PrR006]